MSWTEWEVYQALLHLHLCSAAMVVPLCLWLGSPYGKLASSFKAPWPQLSVMMNGTVGWILMESVALVTYGVCFTPVLGGEISHNLRTGVFAAMWITHYVNRAWVYPMRNPHRSAMGVGTVLMAVVFNAVNGYINGRWVAHFSYYPPECMFSWREFLGIGLFIIGLVGNIHSDNILMEIQRSKRNTKQSASKANPSSRYVIPHGGLFKWVSSPHYLCELMEWCGYAIATNSTPAWLFVWFAAANLGTRAVLCHLWYQAQFPQYPAKRKAIIPFVL